LIIFIGLYVYEHLDSIVRLTGATAVLSSDGEAAENTNAIRTASRYH